MAHIRLALLLLLVPFLSFSQRDASVAKPGVPSFADVLSFSGSYAAQLNDAGKVGLKAADYDSIFVSEIAEGCFPADQDTLTMKNRILQSMYRYYGDLFFGREPRLSFNGLKHIGKRNVIDSIVNTALIGGTFANIGSMYGVKNTWYYSLIRTAGNLVDSVSISPGKRFTKRVNAVNRALHTVRWINNLLLAHEFTMVVNIPSATLLLFHHEKIILESRVIVGRRTTRTPPLASTVSDITIYPYWIVPKSIATKELLPEIKKDIAYLERNSMQVLDKDGHLVNEYAIPWTDLSPGYFPYTIRQSTGCDNSLGLIKFNITNPFNIYLHDTPWKTLFEATNRYYSHGCVRVEKVKELAHVLLGDNSIAVDTLSENGSLLGRRPTLLSLKAKVPVLILYNTAWFDRDGVVRFYPDIYSWFSNE